MILLVNLKVKLTNSLYKISIERISQIIHELQNVTQKEWWEVSERGTNLNWLSDEQKSQLPLLLSWFKK